MSIIEDNEKLIEKYPWFILDEIPQGWIIAFGELMCKDIQQELEKYDYADKYKIIQAKEKYGFLRIYDDGVPVGCKVYDIIADYSVLSEYICIGCGELDVPCTNGSWVVPICKKCIKKMNYKDPEATWNELSEKQAPHTLPLSRRYKIWSPGKDDWEDVTVDLTDTVKRIRKKYAERTGR